MRIALLCVIIGAGLSSPAFAALDFPKLTGRVVDQADMLSSQAEQQVTALSATHEQASGDQIVIVSLPDLQGQSIEEFGYQLGRHWGIGQKDKNNGVVLLIAKAERKVRIEVGYGLEGDLTDAIASNIISTIITPRFKRAQFDEGVVEATAAVIDALGGQYEITQAAPPQGQKTSSQWKLLAFIIFFLVIPGLFGRGRFFGGMLLGSFLGGGRGGGMGGGGFSGGGGSFGGGGASGGW